MSLIKEFIQALTSMIADFWECVEKIPSKAQDFVRRTDAEKELEAVSSRGFVRVFGSVAHQLAEIDKKPYTDAYVSFCREATERLAIGMDQAYVLWYFDKKLLHKKGTL